jgi:hypothetical protein
MVPEAVSLGSSDAVPDMIVYFTVLAQPKAQISGLRLGLLILLLISTISETFLAPLKPRFFQSVMNKWRKKVAVSGCAPDLDWQKITKLVRRDVGGTESVKSGKNRG